MRKSVNSTTFPALCGDGTLNDALPAAAVCIGAVATVFVFIVGVVGTAPEVSVVFVDALLATSFVEVAVVETSVEAARLCSATMPHAASANTTTMPTIIPMTRPVESGGGTGLARGVFRFCAAGLTGCVQESPGF